MYMYADFPLPETGQRNVLIWPVGPMSLCNGNAFHFYSDYFIGNMSFNKHVIPLWCSQIICQYLISYLHVLNLVAHILYTI